MGNKLCEEIKVKSKFSDMVFFTRWVQHNPDYVSLKMRENMGENIDFSELLTPEEVSKILKIELSTVYKYLNEGKIPGVRIGGLWRSEKGELLRLVRKEWSRTWKGETWILPIWQAIWELLHLLGMGFDLLLSKKPLRIEIWGTLECFMGGGRVFPSFFGTKSSEKIWYFSSADKCRRFFTTSPFPTIVYLLRGRTWGISQTCIPLSPQATKTCFDLTHLLSAQLRHNISREAMGCMIGK